MEWIKFKKNIEEAVRNKTIANKKEDIKFWEGYIQGLRRRYHGDKFRTAKEHKTLMLGKEEKAIGYRSGYAGETVIEAGITLTYIYYTPEYIKQK